MVGTTEEFQGQERRIIILTTIRSNPDFILQDQLVQSAFLKSRKRFVSDHI
jgi:helicase MOV-10